MQRALTIKVLTIFGLAILMLIPLAMIKGNVIERDQYRYEAINSVAESWTGHQTLLTPILAIPYIEVVEQVNKVPIEKTEFQIRNNIPTKYKEEITHRRYKRHLFVQPDESKISGSITTETLKRGIYEVPVYESKLFLRGNFGRAKLEEAFNAVKELEDEPLNEPPFLALTVSDTRGISNVPLLTWGDQSIRFQPGANIPSRATGIHAELPNLEHSGISDVSFQLDLNIRGMKNLSFIPSGDSVSVDIKSDWPHPEFDGAFLPGSREISENGFSANWYVTQYASNFGEKMAACDRKDCSELNNTSFGVYLIDPVDVYLKTERSLKYGILFIGLSFICFFLFEVFRKLSIHPVQYGLVGFSLAIFYLLLIALSEHISFGLSYIIATAACIALIFSYLKIVLSGLGNALLFTGSLTVLYAFLYVIIQAEDFAMLLGASLVFGILAILMTMTRQIDWYLIGEEAGKRVKNKKKPDNHYA